MQFLNLNTQNNENQIKMIGIDKVQEGKKGAHGLAVPVISGQALLDLVEPQAGSPGEQEQLSSLQLLHHHQGVTQVCQQCPLQDTWTSNFTWLAACKQATHPSPAQEKGLKDQGRKQRLTNTLTTGCVAKFQNKKQQQRKENKVVLFKITGERAGERCAPVPWAGVDNQH